MTANDREAARIRAEYARRERAIGRDAYALTRPANLFFSHGQQRALRDALVQASLLPLSERRILEIGCGLGKWLAVLESFGARREYLHGIDLDAGRIAESQTRFQGADLRAGDASSVPWPDRHFDVVFQSLVFTSILDSSMRIAVAREMLRVAKNDGVILWYDFRVDNPANRNVRGITSSEMRELFPDCDIALERVTLAPPIARRLVTRSWLVAEALERLRFLNTHYFGVIRPRRAAGSVGR